MPCLPATRRTQLKARLATKTAQLTTAYSTYDNLLGSEIESYKFDSGEGSQSAKRKSLDNLQKTINALESQIDSISRILNGTGIVNVNVRR